MPDLPYKNCINGFIPGPDFPGQLLCMCHPEDGSIPSNDVYNITQLMTIAENHGHSAPGSDVDSAITALRCHLNATICRPYDLDEL